jgi:DNA-binding response OmpR family regulator
MISVMEDSSHTGKKESILIVEDEQKISGIVKAYLEKEQYDVTIAETGEQALGILKKGFSLVILDLMLPDMDGEEICRMIRKESDTPVIMLTAKSGEDDKIAGLGIGADDYVVKPFSPRELIARVKAHLRRGRKARKELLSFNGGFLKINTANYEVFKENEQIIMTPTEFKILIALAENPGRVLSRDQIVNLVQGYDFEGYDRTIDAHIKNLRQKVERHSKEPEFIKTVYGVGYKFVGKPDED